MFIVNFSQFFLFNELRELLDKINVEQFFKLCIVLVKYFNMIEIESGQIIFEGLEANFIE